MKMIVGCIAGLLAAILLIAGSTTYAQSYKMLAPSAGQREFYGSTTLVNGSKTVNVLPTGTVSAAVATLKSGFLTGTQTPRLATTWSGGNITIQAYDDVGTNTSSSATVGYVGAGSQ